MRRLRRFLGRRSRCGNKLIMSFLNCTEVRVHELATLVRSLTSRKTARYDTASSGTLGGLGVHFTLVKDHLPVHGRTTSPFDSRRFVKTCPTDNCLRSGQGRYNTNAPGNKAPNLPFGPGRGAGVLFPTMAPRDLLSRSEASANTRAGT